MDVKKLKERFSSSQIGGKGSVRRKRKDTGHRLQYNRKKSKEEINLIKSINGSNTKISIIKDLETFELFYAWFEDHIYFYFEDLNKLDVKKSYIQKIRDDPVEFFYDNFTVKNEERIKLISDIEILHNIFTQDGFQDILNFYFEIENILTNEKYLELESEESNELSSKECYQILELDYTEELTLKKLKKTYRKKAINVHPDKHKNEEEKYEEKFQMLNKAYKKLLKGLTKN